MRKWLVGLLAAGLCLSSAWATDYTLVESTDDLTAGSYVITGNNPADGAEPAMTAQAPDKNYFYPANVSVDQGVISDPDDNLVWEVAEASGGWSIHSSVGFVQYSGSGNTANAEETVSDKSTWTISIADGVATVLNVATADRKLQYNSGSPRFACYTSNQKGLKFYKASDGPVAFSVKLAPAEDFEVIQGKSASITATVKGAQGDVTYSWSVNGTPIDLAGNVYTVDSAELGEYEVSVEVSDGVADPLSASVKYTVVEAPVVTGDVLTRDTTGVTGTSYKDWTATGDSGTKYAGNSAGGNTSIQLNTGSPKGIVITESAGSDVASVTVEWNDATADKRSIEIYGSADAYAGPAALYDDATKGELLGTLAKGETTLAVPEGYPYVGILAKGGALYLTSVAFEFAGEAGLFVTLDKANGFTVDLGTADSITATAKNGVEPYTYAWTSDTPDLNGTGETLAIPATLAEGDYTVQVEVTDAESNKASKQIGFSVVAPLEPHAININVGIQNGTVTSDPEGEAVKGTQVKLTATATTEGYALKEMTVTYGETVLTFTASPATFEMPDEAVTVGAIFAEVKDYAELPFVAEDTPYTGPWQKATIDGLTSKGLGTDYMSGGVPVAAKFDTTGDWMQIKFAGTPGNLEYAIKGNAISAASNSTFLVQESADGETWTTLATYKSEDETLTTTQTGATNELSASSQFVRFFYETKGAGNVGIYDVYISSGGPATFSIKLDPASYFEVEVGEEASIAATPKNAEGEVHYAWTVGGEPAGSDSAVLGLDTTAATEVIEVVCTATDAADTVATASVSYKVVAPAPKFQIACAIGIPNGSVSADKTEAVEGETVTLTATPDAGYKLEHFLVNDIAISANTFPMPAEDVLVSASFVEITGDQFELVTSLDGLEDGAEYVITDNSQAYAITAALSDTSTKRLVSTAVAPVEGVITTDDAAIVWKLVEDEDGNFALYNDSIGKYIGWSSGNSAKFQDDAFANTISYEDDLFVVMATSTAELEKPRKLQFNSASNSLQFAYYEGTQKNLNFFKKAGASAPKIVYSGETTIALGGTFEIIFGLLNYDGDFEWVLDSREGGTIVPEGRDGLYTWTPTEATGDEGVTIKVVARSGELDIATKEVVLTVTDGPQPGEPAIVFGGDDSGVVGQVVNFTVTAVNISDPTVYSEGFQFPDNSSLTDGDITIDFPNVSFTPDVVGGFTFLFSAGEGDEYAEGTLTITVSDGPGPQPGGFQITGLAKTGGNLVLTFAGEGTPAVLGTASLSTPQEWTPVEGATVSGNSATVPMGAQNYIRLQ